MAECTLVTGGSGFIGAHLAETLIEMGKKVINYDVSSPSPEIQKYLQRVKDKITFIKGNILDLPTLMSIVKENKVNKIVHMAALFDPVESNRIPYYTYQVNLVGLLNILEASRIFDLERVVFTSSIGSYPEKIYEPMDEKHPILIPGTAHEFHYSASKGAGEVVALAYWYINKVNLVIVRYSGVFGFGMRYPMFIKDMIENSLKKLPTKFKTGGNLFRDYTYVKDCVNAVICALAAEDSKLTKRIYLTTSGEIHSAGEVAQMVTKMIPGANIEIGAEMSEAEKRNAAKRGKLDISLAKKELGYAPKFKLEEAIQDYIRIYKEYCL